MRAVTRGNIGGRCADTEPNHLEHEYVAWAVWASGLWKDLGHISLCEPRLRRYESDGVLTLPGCDLGLRLWDTGKCNLSRDIVV